MAVKKDGFAGRARNRQGVLAFQGESLTEVKSVWQMAGFAGWGEFFHFGENSLAVSLPAA
jgi:hypothetical protein